MRRGRPRAGPAIAAVLLTLVWANLHPGALVAPVIAALYLGGLALGARAPGARADGASRPPTAARPTLWLLPPALLAALLATPNGVALFAVPGRISAALQGL